jgi:hypothetical protein
MTAAGLAVTSVAATIVANLLWNRATASAVRRLGNLKHTPEPRQFQAFATDELEGLPAPVRRYFALVLEPGQWPVRSARLTQRGDFAMQPGAWSPFTAVQHVRVRPPGFVWNASIRAAGPIHIRVRDSYIGGVGRMQGRIAGVIPVVEQSGTPEMASGSLHRYLAEAPWVPTALLPSAGVTWTAIDDTTARATLSDRGVTVSVDFQFNERGEITGMSAQRPRDVKGSPVLTPWTGRFWEYETVGGMMIPRQGEVAWMLPEGPYPYWRGRIIDVSHTFDQ